MVATDVSVFVLEDDAMTRQSLERKIDSAAGFSVGGSAGTLAAARQQLLTIHPGLLLTDLQLPDGDGADLIVEYTARHPTIPILVISVFGDEASVVRALSAGAQGYLLKDGSHEDLADSMQQVVDGRSPISPAIAIHLIKRLQAPASEATLWDDGQSRTLLSSRELEVLQLASRGLTYQETADALSVSINTVGTYTRRIYTKLAVTSRAQALFEARQLGLMNVGE